MKNRKILSHDNLVPKTTIPDKSKSQLDVRNKRKPGCHSFFKKSAEILQSYQALFNRPGTHDIGDADTYFRHSLRNYDDFETSRTVKWEQKHLKPDVSIESLKLNRKPLIGQGDIKHKRKSRVEVEHLKSDSHSLGKPYLLSSKPTGRLRTKVDVEEEREYLEETDLDIFYSPNSQLEETYNRTFDDQEEVFPLITNLDQNNISAGEESDVPTQYEFKMAEDDLQGVQDLVEQAGTELSDVVAENPSLQEAIEAGVIDDEEEVIPDSETEAVGETTEASESNAETTEKIFTESEDEGGTTEITDTPTTTQDTVRDGATPIAYDPNVDSTLLRELEDAEKQAMETAKIIFELKQRVAQLLSKSKMTEVESKELEEKNKQLRDQMCLFEAKTKRIQFLVDQAGLFENMISPRPPLGKKHTEDMLPKVIICGLTENNMPKIIVCDEKKKKQPSQKPKGSFSLPPPVSVMPQFAKRLSESYYMQERLAAENADLEGKRYRLQEDLLDKDQTVESLQRQLNSLQGELRMVCKENSLLNDKIQRVEPCTAPCSRGDSHKKSSGDDAPCKKNKSKKMPCGKNKGPCPADVETRLQEYSETTQQLEKQLCDMENEVRNMQTELVAVQQERQHLEQHRRMLCPPPCPPPPCMPPPCMPPPCMPSPCMPSPCMPSPCMPSPCMPPPCMPPPPCAPSGPSADQQLRELREQYNRLQDDYKSKLTEVAGLRADIDKLKQIAQCAEETKKIVEDKMKEYEREMKNLKSEKNKFMGSKEQLVEQEQQLSVAKQRFREAQDELEELRALIQDQQAQLDDYRNKYLQAQQQVEEQRRQIDMMEMENSRISEQVNLEIQRVKNQFQEKLQELTPLPDILKSTQLKLQEAQQMHLLAERNNETLVHELQAYRDKAAAMANQMEKVRSDQQLGADEKASITSRFADCERKLSETQEENDKLKTDLSQMEEIAEINETKVQEKLHEIAQLASQLETVREESARQVARTKDRCETVRRSMQNQIADLERQLAQSRAQARSAQKDRDDIRQKMQSQINNLNENFEDAQMRIRNLQGHVNFLKNSYTNVFPPADGMVPDRMDPCDCGNNY